MTESMSVLVSFANTNLKDRKLSSGIERERERERERVCV
jgi:hypothetical protein